MISWFINSKKIIPNQYVSSVFEIDYDKLYEAGKRLILTDLDNTLISYKETNPHEKLVELKEKVESIGFELIVVSNSTKDRVEHFCNLYGVPFVKFAKKPSKSGYKKGMKIASKKYKKEEVIFLGDQLMTDVYGAHRFGVDVILVKAIDKKTEKWFTKINRRIEVNMLKKAKKKYPELYEKNLAKYVGENFDKKM